MFFSFHWISVSKGPAPLCYNSKYVVGPSFPTHTARQNFMGPSSPHCLRLSGSSSPDNKSQKCFPYFHLPYKKKLLFLSFHWISVVSKGPAPLCYKSKYVVGPSSPIHTARQDFVGLSSPTLSQIIRAQLP